MTLPSKELVSAVLGDECFIVDEDTKNLYLEMEVESTTIINIYEFMHLVKEWIENKYELTYSDDEWFIGGHPLDEGVIMYDRRFDGLYEAGEWVLNQLKGNND